MASALPRVSIGVPVYNGATFLPQTLDSLLAQTHADFELLISDNGSEDATPEICRDYARRDQRVHYFRNSANRGAAWNYNRVFAVSTGEYFKWAAADDLCAPEFLQRCVEVLDRRPSVVLCHARTKIIDARGGIMAEDTRRLPLMSDSAPARFRQLMKVLGECNAIFGVIRTRALRRTRLIGNFIASDSCLLAELSLHGKFFEIPEFLFFRRDHPAASSRARAPEQQLAFFDPQLAGRLVMPQWRRWFENLRAVHRAPIAAHERFLLSGYLIYSLLLGRNDYGRELARTLRRLAQLHLAARALSVGG